MGDVRLTQIDGKAEAIALDIVNQRYESAQACIDAIARELAAARAEERERCAKVARRHGCGEERCSACVGNRVAEDIRSLASPGGDTDAG